MPDLRAVPSAEAPLVEEAQRLTRDASTEDIEAQLAALAIADLGPLREGVVLAAIRGATGRAITGLRRSLGSLRAELKRATADRSWRDGLKRTRYGEPMGSAANVAHALDTAPEWQGVIGLSEFDQRFYLRKPPPWGGEPRTVADADVADIQIWCQHHGIQCQLPAVKAALLSHARKHPFHQVRDWLASLSWDGEVRLDRWLHRGLGVHQAPGYTDVIGIRWLTSAVARVMAPGCQAKYVLALEGPQDIGKSKALGILGGDWFVDDLSELGSKDSKLQIAGAIIVEIADLSGLRRARIEATKAFLSLRADHYRPPFREAVITRPRQCVFATTTNDSEWLDDETGNVRYWPVKCNGADPGWLEAYRDQLWAEAYVRWDAGEQWWLELGSESYELARTEQESRTSYDEFETRIRDWLEAHEPEQVTVTEILKRCLEIEDARDHTKSLQSRVGRIMIHRIGWRMFRSAGKRWYERR